MENNRAELSKSSLLENDQSLASASSKLFDQSLSYLNEHKTEIALGAAAAVVLGTGIKLLANAGALEAKAALHADEFPSWFRPSGAAPQTDEFYALTQGYDPIYSSAFATTPKTFIPDSAWPNRMIRHDLPFLNEAGEEVHLPSINLRGDGTLSVPSRNFLVDGSLVDVAIKNGRVSVAAGDVLQRLQMRGIDLPDSLERTIRQAAIPRE